MKQKLFILILAAVITLSLYFTFHDHSNVFNESSEYSKKENRVDFLAVVEFGKVHKKIIFKDVLLIDVVMMLSSLTHEAPNRRSTAEVLYLINKNFPIIEIEVDERFFIN